MQIVELRSKRDQRRSGFTLVEVLIVIAIMSILMTAGAIGLNGMTGKGITSGVATAESLFDEARATAMGRNIRACVLIAKELDNNPADDLRRMVVAYEKTNSDGTAESPESDNPTWVLSSRGALLPEQTFFSETYSKGGSGSLDTVTLSSGVKSAYRGTYFIYQFNAQGICTTAKKSGNEYDIASFVIGNGSRNTTKSSNEAPPKATKGGLRDFGGFAVFRNGRTSMFRSPDQMDNGVTSLRPGDTF